MKIEVGKVYRCKTSSSGDVYHHLVTAITKNWHGDVQIHSRFTSWLSASWALRVLGTQWVDSLSDFVRAVERAAIREHVEYLQSVESVESEEAK